MVTSLKTVPGVMPVVGVKVVAAFAGVDTATSPAATANAEAKSARGRFIMLFSFVLQQIGLLKPWYAEKGAFPFNAYKTIGCAALQKASDASFVNSDLTRLSHCGGEEPTRFRRVR
jgi:hypothetical protein